MGNSAFYRRRFARTELLVNFKESFFRILCSVLLEDSLFKAFVLAEALFDLGIGTAAERSYKCSKGDLSVLIDSYIDNVVGIHFVFQPSTSVRDNGGLEKILTCFILFNSIVNTRGTNEL